MNEEPERWVELAKLAAQEQDPKKLLALAEEINRLLEEKHSSPENPKAKPSAP
jgi:hypothetical protein